MGRISCPWKNEKTCPSANGTAQVWNESPDLSNTHSQIQTHTSLLGWVKLSFNLTQLNFSWRKSNPYGRPFIYPFSFSFCQSISSSSQHKLFRYNPFSSYNWKKRSVLSVFYLSQADTGHLIYFSPFWNPQDTSITALYSCGRQWYKT